jgi:hypothetical protein
MMVAMETATRDGISIAMPNWRDAVMNMPRLRFSVVVPARDLMARVVLDTKRAGES